MSAGTRAIQRTCLFRLVADIAVRVVFSFGEVSWRIHYIEQNAAAIWRRSVAPSLHFCPSTEMRTHYSQMSEHYSLLTEAEELPALSTSTIST